jgi:hypothetical protein
MTRRLAGVVLAALTVAGTTVRADDPEGNVWLWVRPGWTWADLGQANDLIAAGNAIFEANGLATVAGFHNTFFVQGDLHVNLSDRVTGYGGVGRIFGSRTQSFNRVIRTSVAGYQATAGALYRVPWPKRWQGPLEDLDLFVGGGGAYLGDFEFKASDEDLGTGREFLEERVFTGNGLGAELRINLDYFLNPRFTLLAGFAYRLVTLKNLAHDVRVTNDDVFNPDGDDDHDGVRNSHDPDYEENATRMYGRAEYDPDLGRYVWVKPTDRFLEPLYIYDPGSYPDPDTPPSVRLYDPEAEFDLNVSGFEVQVGLTYYIF